VRNVNDVKHTLVHTTELLALGQIRFEVQIAIENLKKCKLPGSDQIPAELTQAGGERLLSEIHKLINFIRIKEELSYHWKESIIVPIHKIGDKADCNNCCGTSLLSISYKVLKHILLSKLRTYINEIIWDHQ
jgi:hypothetical protein